MSTKKYGSLFCVLKQTSGSKFFSNEIEAEIKTVSSMTMGHSILSILKYTTALEVSLGHHCIRRKYYDLSLAFVYNQFRLKLCPHEPQLCRMHAFSYFRITPGLTQLKR
ncbi:hypothetical protein NPIL_702601 [Nephila pilipes]|uniref:Uncharacterized protein n=1 Tax=Nephila pilipes TaxID=299642 RepID=A0A8X6NLR5_NEPPI|nr:hypothetical protein NPIL_702601 [Nephila pilipes]